MRFARGLPYWLLWIVSVPLIVLALLVSLARHALPLVADYRLELEQAVSDALQVPVSIGRISAEWHGWSPKVLMQDIQLGAGKQKLSLHQISALLDLKATLEAQQPKLGQLDFQGLSLKLSENAEGKWQVEGIGEGSSEPLDVGEVLDVVQRIKSIDLLESHLVIHPWGKAEQSISHIAISVDSTQGQSQLHAIARLPDGKPIALNVVLDADPENWRDQLQAKVYLKLPASDWAAWIPANVLGDWRIDRLNAGAELWVDWRAQGLERASVVLQMPQVKAGHRQRPLTEFSNFNAQLHLQNSPTGYQLQVDQLRFDQGKQHWSDLQLALEQQGARWQAHLNRLEVAPWLQLVQQLLPLTADQQALLADLKPKGRLKDLRFVYDPEAQVAEQRFRYVSALEKVSFYAHGWIPTIENVSGTVEGDLGQGLLTFNGQDFGLHLTELFPDLWRYQTAQGQFGWRVDDQAITLIAPYLQLNGEEGKIAGDFLIRLLNDPAGEDYMDLRVGMTKGDARFAKRYLPTRSDALSKDLVDWLTNSIKGGKVEQGYFQYQGSLEDESPDEASSISLYLKLAEAHLDYQKGWPALQDGQGEVLVENTGTRVFLQQGRLLNSTVRNVQASIPSVPEDQASHLLLNGEVQGTVADALSILKAAPIDAEDVFNTWQGDGVLTAQLNLDIPLVANQDPKVVVDFVTQGATLVMANPDLRLEQLSGKFRYDSARGVSASSMEAKTLGGTVKARLVEAGHAGDPIGRIEAWGEVAIDRLTKWLGLKARLPVAGQLPFELVLTLAEQDSQLQISSSLKGLAIDLPAPFGKPASLIRDTHLRMTLHGQERRYWIEHANLASLSFAAPPDRLNKGRGELRLGGGLSHLPTTSGLRVYGKLASLDLAEWKNWLANSGLVGAEGGSSLGGATVLSSVQLEIAKVTGFGMTVPDVNLELSRKPRSWVLDVRSPLVAGSVTRPDLQDSPLDINVQYVQLPENTMASTSTASTDPLQDIDPKSIPSMNLVVRKVLYGNESFGSWALKSRPQANGVLFQDVNVNLKGLRVEGDAGWSLTSGSWYKGVFKGRNLADILKAWGFAPSVTSERFQVRIDGRWPGSPAALDMKHFSGVLEPEFQSGEFVDLGPEGLRVFGLLNFQAIGRRLRLDFNDLVGKGLNYDEVKGVLWADKGVYQTRSPLILSGPSTNLSLDGKLDMASDRIAANLRVTLPLTGNLPIAGAIVGAPVVGGAIWVVDKLLGNQVSRLTTVQYRIEGPWLSPEITFDQPFDRPRS